MSSLKFSSNTATLGGAIALGSPENNDRVYDQCTFIDNKALDGGAMYLFGDAGVDIINSSVFRGNHASKSVPAGSFISKHEFESSHRATAAVYESVLLQIPVVYCRAQTGL